MSKSRRRASPGRPRQSGERYPSGEIKPRRATPAEGVERRRELHLFGSGSPEQTVDPIGRAWCAGLLDGRRIDAEQLRDVGRLYGALYWAVMRGLMGGRPPVGWYGLQALGGDDDPEADAWREARLDELMDRLRRAGLMSRRAVESLTLDPLDDDPPWLARLIEARRDKRMAKGADLLTLRRALDGLEEMAR